MKLVQTLDPSLSAYVESIQRKLCFRPDGFIKQDNELFFEGLTHLAQSQSNPDAEFDSLPTQLKEGFGLQDSNEFIRRIEEAKSLTTSYELASTLFEFLNLWYEIKYFTSKISGDYGHQETPILIATAAHDNHNARAFIHEESSVHIILFYDRLFDFIADISLLLPVSLMPNDLDLENISLFPSLACKLSSEPILKGSTVEVCLKAFFARHYGGNFSNTKFDHTGLSESIRLVSQDIEQSMRAFIMGHEIAHILCDHVDGHRHWHLTNIDGQSCEEEIHVSEVVRKWDAEYEADYVGFQLGRGVSIGYQIPFETYAWSVLLFFVANEWLMTLNGWSETRIDNMTTEEQFRAFSTHPPLNIRRRMIEELIASVLAEQDNANIPKTFDLTPIKRLIQFVQPALDEEAP